MTKAKMRLLLELSVDLLERLHTNICNSQIEKILKIEMSEDINEIFVMMFKLDKKLKGAKMNDR